MNRILTIFTVALVFFLVDWYFFQAVRGVTRSMGANAQRNVAWGYWGFSVAMAVVALVVQFVLPPDSLTRVQKQFIFAAFLIPYFAKIFGVLILLIDDLGRLLRWLFQKISGLFQPDGIAKKASVGAISRSEFLMKLTLFAAAVPFFSFAWGIISGAHDYRIRRIKLKIKGLPDSFVGMTMAQLSDIHSGSFFDDKAVQRGVKMLIDEKPDLFFFTGDLVNNTADEVEKYIEIFAKINAPMGTFSILGNHDYGDYFKWPTEAAKKANLEQLKKNHARMGWDLILDSHRVLERNGEKIALLGVQNWGTSFAQYGDIKKTYAGTEKYPVKLLLSHDPTHWDAQVRPMFPDISATFSGHTHGMQFGVKIGSFEWSPVSLRYKQWGGLYQENGQYLYVNRGFGYIGYPGRVGILPEITIFELQKG